MRLIENSKTKNLYNILSEDISYKEIPFEHTAVIYYGGTNEEGVDDTGEINCIVDNRTDFPNITDDELHKAFKNDPLDIYNNDLSGEEYMTDIELFDDKGWLEFTGKDDKGNFHFTLTESAIEAKNKKRYAYDIDWETDGDEEAKKELPTKVRIPDDINEDEVADWLSDEYGWLVNSVSLTESAKTLTESAHKIWSNTGMIDYYENMSREDMIKEIKNNGWDEEEINGKPILDADDEELRDYLVPYDIDLDAEDYVESIEPMIEKQCTNDILVLCGKAANWEGSREACKAMNVEDLRDFVMPSYEAHIVLYCDEHDNLFYTESNHDTPVGGTEMYLYSFWDETDYNNAETTLKKLFGEDFDMYYFCDYVGYKEVSTLIEKGLLKPVKRDPQYIGITESHKLSSKKSLTEGGIYPVVLDDMAFDAFTEKVAQILGCDSKEDISVEGLELIPAKGFGGGGQYWFRAQINIGRSGSYHEDFIWKALEAVKDQCPHLYKVYENGTQLGPGSIITGDTNGLEINYYSTIDVIDDNTVSNGLSFEYSTEGLEVAGCSLKELEEEETPVGDYLCNLIREHMDELIELLKGYELHEEDWEPDEYEEYNESVKVNKKKSLKESFDANEPNSMDTVREYFKTKKDWQGSILINTYSEDWPNDPPIKEDIGKVVYDLRAYKPDSVEFEAYEVVEDADNGYNNGVKYEAVTDSYIDTDGFSIDFTDEEVDKWARNKLGINKRSELANVLKDDVKKDAGIEPGSDEEDMLNRIYESADTKKEANRVIMQQGNVSCIKENGTYLVFENESDNEVEHDTEESAMQDFLERVDIDPNRELTESKKLNENEVKATILSSEETGGHCLSYIGVVGDYFFACGDDGPYALSFYDISKKVDTWQEYDEKYEEEYYNKEEQVDPTLFPAIGKAFYEYASKIKGWYRNSCKETGDLFLDYNINEEN